MKNLDRRSTLLGIAIGAAGTLSYLLSCGDAKINVSHGDPSEASAPSAPSAPAAPPAADLVTYDNTRSGLRGTNVQAALDEIGTRLRAAITGTSTWNVQMTFLNTETEALEVNAAGTVTFTESAPGQGSYTTSGVNVIMHDGYPGSGDKWASNSKYFILEDTVSVTAQPKTGGRAVGNSWRIAVSDNGNTMTMYDGGGISLRLTKN